MKKEKETGIAILTEQLQNRVVEAAGISHAMENGLSRKENISEENIQMLHKEQIKADHITEIDNYHDDDNKWVPHYK
jgi:hypothetical protein